MSHLALELVTPPIVEPITTTQAKNFLRVDFDDDDALISGLITAARQYAEHYTHRAFFNQTWIRTLDNFPLWWDSLSTMGASRRQEWPYWSSVWEKLRIDLPKAKTVAVNSITYYSPSAGETITLSPTEYVADLSRMPACIVPAYGTFWPTEVLYQPGSVAVEFEAGSYGDGETVNNCPQTICTAILMLVNHLYNNREAVGPSMSELPFGVKALLNPYRLTVFGYR